MVVTSAPGVLNESCDFTESQAWAARGIETRLTTPLKSSSKKKAKSNSGMSRFHGSISRNFPSRLINCCTMQFSMLRFQINVWVVRKIDEGCG
jgi:hypothetical protein